MSQTIRKHISPFQIVLALLSTYLLLAIAAEAILPLAAETKRLLEMLETGICLIFLWDFGYRLLTTRNKLAYMKWGWVDLLASIPAIDVLRWGQVFRVLRFLRVLRIIKSLKTLWEVFFASRKLGALATMKLLVVCLIIFSSLTVLHFERGAEGGNIKSSEDALWWTLVTLCTVGYGDRFPVTSEGRIIRAFLMLGGCITFATLAGYTATSFVESEKADNNKVDTIEELSEEIRQLKEIVRQQSQLSNQAQPSPNSNPHENTHTNLV